MFYVIWSAFDFTSQTEFQCMKVLWEETNTACIYIEMEEHESNCFAKRDLYNWVNVYLYLFNTVTNASSQFHTKYSKKQNEEKREVVFVFVYTVDLDTLCICILFACKLVRMVYSHNEIKSEYKNRMCVEYKYIAVVEIIFVCWCAFFFPFRDQLLMMYFFWLY